MSLINDNEKILIIAANPESLAIACGGLISKYKSQVDLLCINYKDITTNSALITDKYAEFENIIKLAAVNRAYIEKPASGLSLDMHFQNCLSNINICDYDVVLIPNKNESAPEYRFIGEIFLKALIDVQGCKGNLKIFRYEFNTPIKEANYYEDITDYVESKTSLITCYRGNTANYANEILNLNKFRTYTSTLKDVATHVEAYFAENIDVYLNKPDIINEQTELDYKNDELEKYFRNIDIQGKIDNLSDMYSSKRVIIFGAGDYTRYIFKNYNLSKLDIVAISDKRFDEERIHEFYNLKCIKPSEIKDTDADVILISEEGFVEAYDYLTNVVLKGQDTEIAPLIQTDLKSVFNESFANKVCTRPFHTISIVPTGHCITCCPAYIRNFTIGNLHNEDFESVWRSKRADYLRKSLIKGDYTICDLNTCIYAEFNNKEELSKYYEKDTGVVKMPDTIFMGWDFDCNVACITCRNKIIKNDEKTLKELESIEKNILSACKGAKYFYTSGNGDPFGSSYARSLIKKVVEVNPDIKFLIHTNGVLCNQKICEELNITDKMKSVTFSIHSASKATYDKIVRYGNFDKVIQNLEWVSSLKKMGKIEDIILVFVVQRFNYQDMPDFVRLAEKYDAMASFRYYRQWANNTEYKYEDMAVFEKTHPEYNKFVEILKDKIFDSSHCYLDPSLKIIHESR